MKQQMTIVQMKNLFVHCAQKQKGIPAMNTFLGVICVNHHLVIEVEAQWLKIRTKILCATCARRGFQQLLALTGIKQCTLLLGPLSASSAKRDSKQLTL
jgi:hypothetical protein